MTDFWARRKEAVAEEARAEEAVVEAEEHAATETALANRSDEEILEELQLPMPEDLDSAEGVREFLASALPQRLKTRALRQLWKLNPVLANLDGLVDYGEDFTDSATVIEDLQTAYQVGKGMLKHIEELARADEAAAASEEEPEDSQEISPDLDVAETEDELPEPAPIEIAYSPEAPPAEEIDAFAPSPSRRMQFCFEEPA